MSDIIVGVERTLEDIGEVAKWNKKRLRWIITHNTPNFTRQHIIDLQMVLVSSQRIVKVDDILKHRAMVSFGYECEFEISNKLKGRIKQDGLTYELYVNGKSFNELTKTEYSYEPPKLQANINDAPSTDHDSFNPYKSNKSIKTETNPFMPKPPQSKKVVSSSSKPQKQQKLTAKFVLKQPQKIQDALKSAQEETMRIMIEQKRRQRQAQGLMKSS